MSGVCLPIKVRTRSLAGCSSISSGEAIWTISPAAMKMMMSASFSASLMSWLTKTMVLFSFCCRFFTSSCRDSRVKGSRAEKGSSISTMGGEAARARSTPMRCCWPPESSEGYLLADCSMWTSCSISWTISSHRALSYFSSLGTTQMFWATVMLGNRPICWITYPIRLRSAIVSIWAISRPLISTVPSDGRISLLIILSVVVFPHPLSPNRTTNSPSGI